MVLKNLLNPWSLFVSSSFLAMGNKKVCFASDFFFCYDALSHQRLRNNSTQKTWPRVSETLSSKKPLFFLSSIGQKENTKFNFIKNKQWS